jgi:hypothetical protein
MIPAFKRAKKFHTLDRAATVIGHAGYILTHKKLSLNKTINGIFHVSHIPRDFVTIR